MTNTKKSARNVWGIDPGTKTGWAVFKDGSINYGVWNCTAKKTKALTEPNDIRLMKLWDSLCATYRKYEKPDSVVIEGATGFTRGKAAVRVSNELRGVIKLWCLLLRIDYTIIEPVDLKRFALGKGSGDKGEMIAATAEKYAIQVNDDNEADALHLLHWGIENRSVPVV